MPVLSLIHKYFPPPRYMTLPSVGVDISDTGVKYVGFKPRHDERRRLELSRWGDIPLPTGAVERGRVHDVAALTDALLKLKRATKTQYVALSLPEERAYLFETTLPKATAPNEVRGLLEFRLEENVPLSPRDAYFDYAYVGEDVGEDERLAVAVYAKDTIESYFKACVDAGLIPVAFEIEAQAIARAVVSRNLSGTYLIVDFGKTRMGVGIVHRGVLMYTSTIDISGQEMVTALSSKHKNLGDDDIIALINTKGLLEIRGNELGAKVLRTFAKTIADELSIRTHYWHTRDIDKSAREIKQVILCGGSANLEGLPEYLSTQLGIETVRAKVWQNAFSLDVQVPPITRRFSYGYATAIGLALRGLTPYV